MKTLMQQKFEELLRDQNLQSVLNKTIKKVPSPNATHKGRHALHKYVGVVEFPLTQGGGVVWLKSVNALRNYEAKGWNVVYL